MSCQKNLCRDPGVRWVPDDEAQQCPRCQQDFGLLKRRHHCRVCGKVLCADCCPVSPRGDEHRRCKTCYVPRCLVPTLISPPHLIPEELGRRTGRQTFSLRDVIMKRGRGGGPFGLLDGTPATTILSFLDGKSLSHLLISSKQILHNFPVPLIEFRSKIEERYPAYFEGAVIGKGGFGTVYRVQDRERQCFLAIKVLKKANIQAYMHYRKLLEEIALLEDLAHPNIARIVDKFQTKQDVVIVAECGEGGTLRKAADIVRQKGEIEAFVAHVVPQIASALKYLYFEKRIIHRDLKQENVVLSRDFSRVMIIDFGLAERVTSDRQMYVPCGTQGYAPPEVVSCVVQRRSKFECSGLVMHLGDFFSLGIILYQVLSETRPMRSNAKWVEMERDIQRGIRCEGRYWASISPEAKMLVEGLLTPNPERRLNADQIPEHPFIRGKRELFARFMEEYRESLNTADMKEREEYDIVDVTPKHAGVLRNGDDDDGGL